MLLVYDEPSRELAFSNYVSPTPRIGSMIIICLLPVTIYQSYTIYGYQADFSSSVDGAMLLMNAWLAIFCIFGAGVFIAHQLALQSNAKIRALLCWLHDCNWAVLCAVAFVHYRPQAVAWSNNNCQNDVYLYQQTPNTAFKDFNCWRRFQVNSGLLILVACVILNVRFKECAIAAAIGSLICTPICLAVWPHRHIELNIADFIYTLAITAFITFARYEMEKDQRRAFEVHEALGRHLAQLTMLANEIERLVDRLLPHGIIARSSSAKLRAKLKERDISHEAIALVMKVSDFTRVSTEKLPSGIAQALEASMMALTQLLPDCGLERVSVLLDEFVAVGNLLEPINMRRSVISTCNAAKTLVAIRRPDLFPLVFGIDIGTAVGEFVGSTDFMRYDVRGPAITTARSLASFAKPHEVLLSRSATELASDALVVADGHAPFDTSTSFAESASFSNEAYAGSDRSFAGDSIRHFVLTEISRAVLDELTQEPLHLVLSSETNSANKSTTQSGEELFVSQMAWMQRPEDNFDPLDSELQRDYCLYRRFHDPDVEQEYTTWRMHANVNRGQRTWWVYAWVVLAFAVVLLLDMDEVRGPYGLILFMVASFASFVASQLPSRLKHLNIAGWFHWWGALTLLIPLVVITGMGISRPSAIGSDVRVMLFAGVIARVTSFAHARHKLLATPVLVLLSHLHYLAPGGVIQLPTILQYIVVFVFVIGNAAVDNAQRLAFAASRRVELAATFLEREQELRLGLLRSTMPRPVFNALHSNGSPGGVLVVPESFVAAVSRVGPTSQIIEQSPTEIPRAEDFDNALCEALGGLSEFHIISISGDRALVMAGVCTSEDETVAFTERVQTAGDQVLLEMLTFCTRMTANGPYRCIADIEATAQAINPANATVTFGVYGVAVTRTLAIDAAAGEALGVLVTSHVMSYLSAFPDLPLEMTTETLPTWRVRGVGQFHLTRLRAVTPL